MAPPLPSPTLSPISMGLLFYLHLSLLSQTIPTSPSLPHSPFFPLTTMTLLSLSGTRKSLHPSPRLSAGVSTPFSPNLPCPRPSPKIFCQGRTPRGSPRKIFSRGRPQVRLSRPPLPLPPLNPIPNPPPKRVRTPQEGDGGGGRERPRVPLGPPRFLNHRPLRRGLVTPQAQQLVLGKG